MIDKKQKGYTVIFHNGGGYDFNFIMTEMINNGLMPEIWLLIFPATSLP